MVTFVDHGISTSIDESDMEETWDVDSEALLSELDSDGPRSEPFEGFACPDETTTVDGDLDPELRELARQQLVRIREPESSRDVERGRPDRDSDLYSTDVISKWMVDPFQDE